VRALGELKAMACLALVVTGRYPQSLWGGRGGSKPEERPMAVPGYLRATESYTFALHGELGTIQAFAMH